MSEAKSKILLVDDEPEIARLLSFRFEKAGIETTVAHNGDDAIAKFADGEFDAIVTDVQMHNGSGVDLVKKVKSGQSEIPIYFVTAFSDLTIDEACRLGVAAVFTKPVKFDALKEAVQRDIGKKEDPWPKRFPELEVPCRIEKEGKVLSENQTSHLGYEGLCCKTEGKFELGDEVDFFLTIPGGKVQGRAKVEWKLEGQEVGLRFFDFKNFCWSNFIHYINQEITKNET